MGPRRTWSGSSRLTTRSSRSCGAQMSLRPYGRSGKGVLLPVSAQVRRRQAVVRSRPPQGPLLLRDPRRNDRRRGRAPSREPLFEKPNSKYRVPVIVYETVTSDQIHEVFSLYNKQGKHLNAEEIRNALYHNLDFMRALLVTAGDSDEVDAVAPFLSEIWDRTRLNTRGAGQLRLRQGGLQAHETALLGRGRAPLQRRQGTHPFHRGPGQRPFEADRRRCVGSATQPGPSFATRCACWTARSMPMRLSPTTSGRQRSRTPRASRSGRSCSSVATLIAFSAAAVVLEETFEQRLEESLGAITRTVSDWRRPAKTQTESSGSSSPRWSTELLDILGVAPDEADGGIASRLRVCRPPALMSLAPTADEHRVAHHSASHIWLRRPVRTQLAGGPATPDN